MIMNFTPIDPIQALYWSAVINGVSDVTVMAVMMILAHQRDIMGQFLMKGNLELFGWLATISMGIIVVAMLITAL
jgi:Mn2+/Fe2+ NRAMP family transporter